MILLSYLYMSDGVVSGFELDNRKAGLCALYGADVGLFGPIPHAYHTGLHNLTIRIM